MRDNCDIDQLSFKAYLSRWMADTTQVAPWTYNAVMAKLQPTAEAAVAQCVGGSTGTYCGFHWTTGTYDGTTGVGQQMGVLEAVQGLLSAKAKGPVTSTTGGSSKGNSAAGTGADATDPLAKVPVTTADRVGAGVVTAVFGCAILATLYFMIS